MVILITVDAIANPQRILTMLLVRITGSQLRAGRVLADLSIEDLAARANRDASRAANGAESRSAKVLQWCAARLPTKARTHKSRPIAQPQLMSASPS
jgi:hypothetical protein